jgi:hypothetical protein
MPNYCYNKLTVTNSTPKLEAFLKEHGLSFEAIVKPKYPENDETGFGAISAQASAWGTKWDLTEEEAKEAAVSLLESDECKFDTAWSPPSEAIRALSELTGASFLLACYEPGCWFWGAESISDGHIADEVSCNETQEQLHEFLVQYMDYSDEEATEAVGWDEEDEESEGEEE